MLPPLQPRGPFSGAVGEAVSHAGHGITSWALNFHLVYEQLAVIMQVGWGGFERDNAKAAQTIAKHWARVAQLLATPPDPSVAAQRQRLVVPYSDFREPWGCSWVTRPGTYQLGNIADGFDRQSTFDVVVRLWSQPND